MKLYVYRNDVTGEYELLGKKLDVSSLTYKLMGTITLDAPVEEPKPEPMVWYIAIYNDSTSVNYQDLTEIMKYHSDARYIVKHTYYPDDPRKNTSEVIAYETV